MVGSLPLPHTPTPPGPLTRAVLPRLVSAPLPPLAVLDPLPDFLARSRLARATYPLSLSLLGADAATPGVAEAALGLGGGRRLPRWCGVLIPGRLAALWGTPNSASLLKLPPH